MIRVSHIKGNFAYTLTSTVICPEDFSRTVVYGISIIPMRGDHQRVDVEAISNDFNVVFDLFGWIVDDELLPEHLLKAVKDYLVGQYPKIIPLSRYLNRPLIA